jgi:RNase H-fold protein (predicted Holliday junction resolvase)
MTNFVNLRKHMNILIVGAPRRFDLLSTSCVNEAVIAYNRKLHKRVKQFEHVKIIDSELQRKYFTKHGMHMNIAGREQMAQKIAEHIRETFSKRETPPITLQWKQDIVKRTAST